MSEQPTSGEATADAPTGPRTVAQAIVEALTRAGVDRAFTVPGESFLELLDALDEAGIRVVATRHEGGAAFMAEATARLTGRPGLCLATRAVGAANLAIGIHAARADSTPLVAIVGGVRREVAGREAFQEADLVGGIGRLAKWSAELHAAGNAERLIAEALREAASGRPGPVLLVVPEDLWAEQAGEGTVTADSTPARAPHLDPAVTRACLHLLAGARRPVILAGGGVIHARASEQLRRVAEAVGAPVIAAWRRPDVFPNDHPLYLGMTGFAAPPTVRARLESADALLAIGCRLNEPTTFGYAVPAAGTRWMHVDLAPRGVSPGLSTPERAVSADARAFLDSCLGLLRNGALEAEPRSARLSGAAADREAYEAARRVDGEAWDGPGVHPGRVVTTLQRALPAASILTVDAGNFGGWLARGYRFRRPGTFLGPTSGAMGYGLPAAIAASLSRPDRPVVALAGDGGFAMTMNELETAVREGARPICIVFDNQRYGTIAAHQRAEHRPVASDLGPIDFSALAQACGALAWRVEDDAAFEPALREALAARKTAVLHLILDRRWESVDSFAGDS